MNARVIFQVCMIWNCSAVCLLIVVGDVRDDLKRKVRCIETEIERCDNNFYFNSWLGIHNGINLVQDEYNNDREYNNKQGILVSKVGRPSCWARRFVKSSILLGLNAC